MRTRVLIAALGAGAALVVAGCSGGSGNTAGGGGGQTVQVATVGAMSDVLTDSAGRTLYVSDQESGGTALCTTSDCTAIWIPLTVTGQPTGPASVAGALGTVTRADGTAQVALHGKPLYRFSFDHAAGQATGDGRQDAFGGTSFTWHVATTSGAPGGTPSQPPAGGSGY
jgi:predicted lipoprotein with Yx(FWY)xxD motif